MAKCPKCSARKGKRQCPALGAEICSTCCGEHRLRTIECPNDCQYLGAEAYQRQRRQERARSQGRRLLEGLQSEFAAGPAFEFAFRVVVEVYAFSKRERSVNDEEVLLGLDSVRAMVRTIYVPDQAPSPLGQFLLARLDSVPELSTSDTFTNEDREKLLEQLSKFARAASEESRNHFVHLMENFLDPLDLEIDLGYRWGTDETEKQEQSNYERRSSGLIVPPSLK